MNTQTIAQLIDLSGKTALVTGGAMGIGLGISSRLAEAGAAVVIADMNETSGQNAVAELVGKGWKAAFVKTDVSKQDDVTHAVAFTKETYGGVDILVNNAGIYPNTPIAKMNVSLFQKIIAVNLESVFMFTKAVTEVMIAAGKGGKIINVTSIDALHPSSVGLAAYDASKHGLWGFTKNSALEFAPYNIQINAIAPGGVATPGTGAGAAVNPEMEKLIARFLEKIPMKRMGDPDEIGKVALFLASDMASYMTGTQVVVDGGVLLS